MNKTLRTVVAAAAMLAFAGLIAAQVPALKRTIVTQADVSVPNREAVVVRADITAGDSFVIPARVVHNGGNEGAGTLRIIGVYVVEKGKPLASPASAPAP